MDLAWLPNTPLGRLVGDYLSTAFSCGHTLTVFVTASAPTEACLLEEAMHVAVG